MTQTEFRKILSEANNVSWFNEREFIFNFTHINLNLKIKGFANFYIYLNQQILGWRNLSGMLPGYFLKNEQAFQNVRDKLIHFLNSYKQMSDGNSLNSYFREFNKDLNREFNGKFTFDCPETEFLIQVQSKYPNSFNAAHSYFLGNFSRNINDKHAFNGYLLASEFSLKDSTEITERRNKEKLSLSRLRSKFESSFPEMENQLIEHLKNNNAKTQEYIERLEADITKINKNFTNWFSDSDTNLKRFTSRSENKVRQLENLYQEKLKLEEPAKYWEQRGKKLKRQGWFSLAILVALVVVVVISLQNLLWRTPEQIYSSFFNGDKSTAIRWSIIYITFISFMAFAIRAITKVMFSSFHLARDCEERYTLTYFYLALLKDSSVDKDDKKLIMQSLFSRAETGLIKDDSSPTMPNDIVGKFMGK